jgi:hypothetical protein
MDFLDPKKERRSRVRLLLGYGLVALAIGIATLILLYQANGYGIDRKGNVTQNGLLFVSSQPTNAAIDLNGQRYKASTDTRVVVPANTYKLQISETGYRTWQRQVVVNGGDVQHFDYPFLFPQKLQTTSLADLAADPSVTLQTPDKRWLLLGQPAAPGTFTEYDLKAPAKPVASEISLPTTSFTPGDGAQTWSLVEWAADNRHVLLAHTYVTAGVSNHEYILLDRDTPIDSVNLSQTLKLSQAEALTMFNNRVDQLYVFDDTAHSLERVNASDAAVISKLDHVLAFKSYGDNEILYVSDQSPTGKATTGVVTAVLQDAQKTITLHTLPAGASNYALNLARYAGDWYVAIGANTDTAAYVYKNPQTQQVTPGEAYPAPWRRLSVAKPGYLSFSSNTQFLLAENGQDFVVYDLENIVQYHYLATEPIDQPQTHATWMDGDRLQYVSGGKLTVFDYDYRNRQSLVPANAGYLPAFAQDYSYLYTLRAATATDKAALTTTPLVVK